MAPKNDYELLFSYGTLQRSEIQVSTFGRLLDGRPDQIPGYEIALIPIADPATAIALGMTHYQNIKFTGRNEDIIEGTVFRVTREELEQSDDYEIDADY